MQVKAVVSFTGRIGAGQISCGIVKAGDQVLSVSRVGAGGAGLQFGTFIAQDSNITQTNSADLSGNQYIALIAGE